VLGAAKTIEARKRSQSTPPRRRVAAPAASSTSFLVGVPFACRNQAAQTVVDVKVPCACTFTVAFDRRNQADVRKAQLGLVALLGDLKENVSAVPLSLVFDKADLGVKDVPHNFLARHQFSDLLAAAVNVLVSVRKLGTEFIGIDGLDVGTEFCEGHKLNRATAGLVPATAMGRMLSSDQAAELMRRI
jgi:hypothetical protein